MAEPLVSIITPTYDRPGYLREAIESVLAQTFGDFELLVCDDGSPPATEELVKSFDDPRIVYLRSPGRLGVLDNSLMGFARARGRYVTALFDDDAWEPEFLERVVAPL